MKLVIHYDFMEAICNAREPFNAFKVIRNKKTKWKIIYPPLFIGFSVANPKMITSNMALITAYMGAEVIAYQMAYKLHKVDMFYDTAKDRLTRLVSQLNDLNISTDYDLLLQSQLYKKYKKLDLKNFQLIENKYVMIPTYNFNKDVKDTSILQEHVIGSSEYILSLGSFKKSLQPAYSNI